MPSPMTGEVWSLIRCMYNNEYPLIWNFHFKPVKCIFLLDQDQDSDTDSDEYKEIQPSEMDDMHHGSAGDAGTIRSRPLPTPPSAGTKTLPQAYSFHINVDVNFLKLHYINVVRWSINMYK